MRLALLLVLAVMMAGPVQVVRGCAICAEIPGASGQLDSRLLEIALAIRHEIDSGGLAAVSPAAPLPTSGRVLGRRMARMLEGQADSAGRLELLLIDSGARFRFDPALPERGFASVSAEKKGPAAETRWITGLDVFHAILEGRMEVDTAMVRGILVIEPVTVEELLAAGPSAPGPSRLDEESRSGQSVVVGRRFGSLLVLAALAVLMLTPIVLVLRSYRSSRAGVSGSGAGLR